MRTLSSLIPSTKSSKVNIKVLLELVSFKYYDR